MPVKRLDKLVADSACISRKDAKAAIRGGLVAVGGVAVTDPGLNCAPGTPVTLAGRPLCTDAFVYIMLNKPAGVVCATRDRLSETVLELLPAPLRRKGLFPAGRLDKDTEGFVLITDDGRLAHNMLAPKRHVPKTYLVRLDSPCDTARLADAFARGVDIGNGETASAARLTPCKGAADGAPLYSLVIHEGMYHQVKRMFAAFGHKVTELRRVQIGSLALDPALLPGECRALSPDEVQKLLDVQ